MASRLRWVAAAAVLAAMQGSVGESAPPERARPDDGHCVPDHSGCGTDRPSARNLVDSGRSVINENQPLFDDPVKVDKGFTLEAFQRQLADMFRIRSGIDLAELDSARVPAAGKKWLKELLEVSKDVVKDAQPDINRPATQSKLIPAVFGSRVAGRFTERTGIRMKQTALVPRNPANAPDAVERLSLEMFAVPDYPREKAMSEVTAKSGIFRLMFPLYMTRQCLACHGEPKGTLDKTGYPREGLRLGQNAGAISVVIPISR